MSDCSPQKAWDSWERSQAANAAADSGACQRAADSDERGLCGSRQQPCRAALAQVVEVLFTEAAARQLGSSAARLLQDSKELDNVRSRLR